MATLTWDRGLELAAHRTFSIATGVQVYFCVPRRVGQRPSAVLDMLADVVGESVRRYQRGRPLPIVPATPPPRTELPPPAR